MQLCNPPHSKIYIFVRIWRKGNPCTLLNVNWYSHCGKVSQFLNKLKLVLPHDPTVLPLGVCSKKTNILIRKDTYIPLFLVALFTIAKT